MSTVNKNHGVAAACIFSPQRLSHQACPSALHTPTALPIAFSDQHRIVEVNIKIGEKDCRLKLLAASYDVLFNLLKNKKLAEVVS